MDKLNRRSFFAALAGAPVTAAVAPHTGPVCSFRGVPVEPLTEPVGPPLGELIMKIGCDTSEFDAAMRRITAELERWPIPPSSEELRAQLEGMPPVKITMNGKVIDKLYVNV